MSNTDKLAAYIEEMASDVELDELCVKEVQMKLPALKHKWVGRLMQHKSALGRLYNQKAVYKEKAVDAVKAEASYNMSDRAIETACETQPAIIDMNNQIKEHKLVIEFLEKSERIFSSLTFDIKNLVEIIKLETM